MNNKIENDFNAQFQECFDFTGLHQIPIGKELTRIQYHVLNHLGVCVPMIIGETSKFTLEIQQALCTTTVISKLKVLTSIVRIHENTIKSVFRSFYDSVNFDFAVKEMIAKNEHYVKFVLDIPVKIAHTFIAQLINLIFTGFFVAHSVEDTHYEIRIPYC